MSWATRLHPLVIATAVLGTVLALALTFRTESSLKIDAVRHKGALVVAVREGPASYFEDGFGPGGFEYALAEGFARELGVTLVALPVTSEQEGLDLVASGKADIAVGQALDDSRLGMAFATSVPVRSTGQLVICVKAAPAGAASLADVIADQGVLLVPEGSHQSDYLEQASTSEPRIDWRAVEGATEENLLAQVHQDKGGCTIVDADAWAFHRHLYPKLVVAAEFDKPMLFGWVQSREEDGSLRQAANAYLARRQADGSLAALDERHFAHLETLTEDDSRHFFRAIRDTLPRYAGAFRQEAGRNALDWRLVAAVAYQESHWDPAAQSPTGVQGIMQLTIATALGLGIPDRTDPLASISGGARYLRQTIDALPEDVPEPDRTWMALAAYNAGIAHVLDARELTRQRGGNPNAWADVRGNLALLKDQKWYTKTRYGYARGATQAIIFVRHVRRYYDLLVLAGNSSESTAKRLAMNDTARSAAQ